MAVKRIEGGKGQKRLKYGFAIFIFVVGISTVLVVSVNLSLVGKRSQIQQAGDQHSFEAPKVSTRNSAKERPNMSVNKQNDHEIGDTTSQDGRKFSLDEKVSPRKESELQKSRVSEQQQDPLTSKPHQYHVVFSTSCHVKQDWQSYLFFYQAMIQKQEGNVTRIVSGCTPEQEAQMMKVHEEQITIMSDRFHLHFTPEFGKIPGKSYQETKYWNKPFGMRHWLENKLGYRYEGGITTRHDDDIVILVDPDMLMQRRFVNDFSDYPLSLWRRQAHYQLHPDQLWSQVSHGHPIAQDYSFRDSWLKSGRISSHLTHIVGPNSPVHNISEDDSLHYSAGPPYMLTARDMYRVTHHWADFLPRMFDVFHGFMAEMYAYCMAAAHLELRHQIAVGFMISNVDMIDGEGWRFTDDMTDQDACQTTKFSKVVPHVIHFCQRYSIGDFFLNKYLLPPDLLSSCDQPLMELPPVTIAATVNYSHYGDGTYTWWNTTVNNFKWRRAKKHRNTFMVCSLMSSLNRAATFYKDHNCPNSANYNQTWNHFRSMNEKEKGK